MLVDLSWYDCNKILRLLKESHEQGTTYAGDEELQAKIESHKHSIEVEKEWSMLPNVPVKQRG